jgi:multiple sugar transport system substrate-binding protein
VNWKPATALAVGVLLVVAGLLVLILGGDPDEPDRVVVSPAWLNKPPSGPVRFCGGEDVSAGQRRSERDFNRRFPGSKATFDEASFTADSHHDLYLKLIERGKDDCDVIILDVVYMREFVAKDLLYDMTPYLEADDRQADFVDQAMKMAEYEGKLWGVPTQLEVGVLYYRADRVPRAPSSWQDVYQQAKPRSPDNLPGLRLQRGPYEGLTVVFLEFAYAAGARPIISEDGETADIDQPQVRDALRFMRNAIGDRVIPDVEQPQIDEGNLEMYELGRARFLRGWPYVSARIEEDPADPRKRRTRRVRRTTAENTTIVSLPPWQRGGQSVGVLGGHNLVIPRSARHPSAALHLIEFLTSHKQVRRGAEEDSGSLPVLKIVADDPDLRRNRKLVKAVKATKAMPRPSIPEYAEVSKIISDGVEAVLDADDDAAAWKKLQQIERDVQKVLD